MFRITVVDHVRSLPSSTPPPPPPPPSNRQIVIDALKDALWSMMLREMIREVWFHVRAFSKIVDYTFTFKPRFRETRSTTTEMVLPTPKLLKSLCLERFGENEMDSMRNALYQSQSFRVSTVKSNVGDGIVVVDAVVSFEVYVTRDWLLENVVTPYSPEYISNSKQPQIFSHIVATNGIITAENDLPKWSNIKYRRGENKNNHNHCRIFSLQLLENSSDEELNDIQLQHTPVCENIHELPFVDEINF